MFFTAFVLSILRLFKLKTEGRTIALQSHKTQIKILAYHELPYLGFEQPSPGVSLSGLAKSIYYKTPA